MLPGLDGLEVLRRITHVQQVLEQDRHPDTTTLHYCGLSEEPDAHPAQALLERWLIGLVLLFPLSRQVGAVSAPVLANGLLFLCGICGLWAVLATAWGGEVMPRLLVGWLEGPVVVLLGGWDVVRRDVLKPVLFALPGPLRLRDL